MEKFYSFANPIMLAWARKSARYSLEDAAKKANVKSEKLELWEKGELNPTIRQLRLLGQAYKRPIAIFYLPHPPKDFTPLKDYRRFPGHDMQEVSPQLSFAYRNALNRREIALELSEELDMPMPEIKLKVSVHDDPEEVGEKIRKLLNIKREEQSKWVEARLCFNNWRAALESIGVLVFQAKDVDVEEMRGFSISEKKMPVVVLNRKEISYRSRIFTMLHEFNHILLRQGGLCDLQEERAKRPPEEQRTEVFCNHVAGATLAPRSSLIKEEIVQNKGASKVWTDEEIQYLANIYSVGREALVRRLLLLNLTTKSFYETKRKQYIDEFKAIKKKDGGFPTPSINVVSLAGKPFVQLVLDAFYQEKITASTISDFLEVKMKHVPKIEAMVNA